MTLILTNDDGTDAPGIRALHKALNGTGILVAPKEERSGCGHRATAGEPVGLKPNYELFWAEAQLRTFGLKPNYELFWAKLNACGQPAPMRMSAFLVKLP
ncbi:MAG: hypothetical protein MUC60_04070 [Oscillatoria sp. Prado101]|nr:hypothetical protein [Oscillatoria sp. Prado101]